jgi:hypothetical protein
MYDTPAVTLKYHFNHAIYSTLMIQRSTDPDTGIWGMRSRDRAGLRFLPHGDGALFMPEIGFKVDAAPGHMMTFFRATGFYNTSRFLDYSNPLKFVQGMETVNYGLYGKLSPTLTQLLNLPELIPAPYQQTKSGGTGVPTISANGKTTMHNAGFGVTIDRQLTQNDKYLSYRGIYANAIVQYALPSANVYSQYYQTALYSLGLLKSRPLDMMVINVNRTQYSRTALNTMQALPAGMCPYAVTGEILTGTMDPNLLAMLPQGVTGLGLCTDKNLGPTVVKGVVKTFQNLDTTPNHGLYQFGQATYDDTTEISGTYSYHVMRGVYANTNWGFTRHPAYAPKIASPVSALFSIAMFY